MNAEIGFLAFEFARRKVKFHNDTDWKDIELFGLFCWGDVSKYLVGNPSHLKTFKKGLIKTNMNKSNKIVWCQPTEEFWNNYIQPILNIIQNMCYEHKIVFLEEGYYVHKEQYIKAINTEN